MDIPTNVHDLQNYIIYTIMYNVGTYTYNISSILRFNEPMHCIFVKFIVFGSYAALDCVKKLSI